MSREAAYCHSGVSIEDLGTASARLYLGFLLFTNPKNEMERIATLTFYMLQDINADFNC